MKCLKYCTHTLRVDRFLLVGQIAPHLFLKFPFLFLKKKMDASLGYPKLLFPAPY